MVEKKNDPAGLPDLEPQVRRILENEELMRAYWDSGHDHLWSRTWSKVRDAIGGWFLRTAFAAAMAGLVVYGVQHGWWK